MAQGYSETLESGQEIYIPIWAASVALGNLTKAGQYIGSEYLIPISELKTNVAIQAILESKDQENPTALIKHFVCEVRMDGKKLYAKDFDDMFEGELYLIVDLFCHVIKAQYASFFAQGLAKAASLQS